MNDPEGAALVTGASAGIGRSLAREFAAGGYDLVVVARREEQLVELAEELRAEHGIEVHTIPMDLAEPRAARKLYDAVAERGVRIDVLVNNVGVAAYGRFDETDLDRELAQLRLNVELPMHLTKLYLPEMIERDEGSVLNVASMAAFFPGPQMAGYYASKAYLLQLSEALATELRGTGVSVTTLCPGPVRTEFQERAGMQDTLVGSRYTHSIEEVARAGYRGAMKGRLVAVPGLSMRVLSVLARLSPRRLQRHLAAWANADR